MANGKLACRQGRTTWQMLKLFNFKDLLFRFDPPAGGFIFAFFAIVFALFLF